MTSNTRKFSDGANYSLKSALSTWNKGGNRVLTALFFEVLDVKEHRNSTNLKTIAQTMSTDGKCMDRFKQILKAVSDGSIRIIQDKKTKQLKVNLAKPEDFKLDNDKMAILTQYAGKGLSFMNNDLAAALGIGGGAPADFDLAKRANSLVKKAMEEGYSEAAILAAIRLALSEHTVTEGEVPTKGAKSKPVMDSAMARAAA